ncbi:hypothetical protein TrLO_g9962 [Triparma laevis f. longispina]|uniref:LNR domain-containing protein n=1 Tax=Triparma laevis f. longispina TaxID=1714387 RepID=A0A9W7DMM9_9STRA|nr:hypothetical protein TrLO_g9962 [Triparma laevis f. longispina]
MGADNNNLLDIRSESSGGTEKKPKLGFCSSCFNSFNRWILSEIDDRIPLPMLNIWNDINSTVRIATVFTIIAFLYFLTNIIYTAFTTEVISNYVSLDNVNKQMFFLSLPSWFPLISGDIYCFSNITCQQLTPSSPLKTYSMNPNFASKISKGDEGMITLELNPPSGTQACFPGASQALGTKGSKVRCEMYFDVNVVTLASAINLQLEKAYANASTTDADILEIKKKHFVSAAARVHSEQIKAKVKGDNPTTKITLGIPKWSAKAYSAQTQVIFAPKDLSKDHYKKGDYMNIYGPQNVSKFDDFAYIITSGAEHIFLPNVTAWVDDCNQPCEVSSTFEECEAMDYSLELGLYKYMYNERLQQFTSPTTTFLQDPTTPDEFFGTKAFTNGLECGNMGKKAPQDICSEFEDCFSQMVFDENGALVVQEESEADAGGWWENYDDDYATWYQETYHPGASEGGGDTCGPIGDGKGYLSFDLSTEKGEVASEARIATCYNNYKEFSLSKDLGKSLAGALGRGEYCEWSMDPPMCIKSFIGDGWCDKENNNPCCNWDGGDCCDETCTDEGKPYECGQAGYRCAARSQCKDSLGVSIDKCTCHKSCAECRSEETFTPAMPWPVMEWQCSKCYAGDIKKVWDEDQGMLVVDTDPDSTKAGLCEDGDGRPNAWLKKTDALMCYSNFPMFFEQYSGKESVVDANTGTSSGKCMPPWAAKPSEFVDPFAAASNSCWDTGGGQ